MYETTVISTEVEPLPIGFTGVDRSGCSTTATGTAGL